MFDKLLYAVVILALVAVVFSSTQTVAAINNIGAAFVKLTTNILGAQTK